MKPKFKKLSITGLVGKLSIIVRTHLWEKVDALFCFAANITCEDTTPPIRNTADSKR